MSDNDRSAAVRSIGGSEAAGEAAAGVVSDLFQGIPNQPVEGAPSQVPSAPPANAVADVIQGMVGPVENVIAVGQAAQPHDPATPDDMSRAPGFEYPELSPDLPEDVQALLDEPDFDFEAQSELEEAAETVAQAPTWDEDTGQEEYQSEELQAERKKRIAAEKKAAWFQQQRVNESRKHWAAEVQARLPLVTPAQLAGIEASSRRGFWREAKAIHDRNAELVRPLIEKIQANSGQIAAKTTEDARAEAAAAWGRPTVAGPAAPTVPAEAAAKLENMERARRRGDFTGYVKSFLNG